MSTHAIYSEVFADGHKQAILIVFYIGARPLSEAEGLNPLIDIRSWEIAMEVLGPECRNCRAAAVEWSKELEEAVRYRVRARSHCT